MQTSPLIPKHFISSPNNPVLLKKSLPIPLSHSPKQSLISMDLPILWPSHINGTTQYVVFCIWLLSLSINFKVHSHCSMNQCFISFYCCSVAQLCLTLCKPTDCSTSGFLVLHYLLEFAQTHVLLSRWCHPTVSFSVTPFSSCPQSFPASESLPMSWLFTSGG